MLYKNLVFFFSLNLHELKGPNFIFSLICERKSIQYLLWLVQRQKIKHNQAFSFSNNQNLIQTCKGFQCFKSSKKFTTIGFDSCWHLVELWRGPNEKAEILQKCVIMQNRESSLLEIFKASRSLGLRVYTNRTQMGQHIHTWHKSQHTKHSLMDMCMNYLQLHTKTNVFSSGKEGDYMNQFWKHSGSRFSTQTFLDKV